MKARIKLALGVTFAAIAVMAASESINPTGWVQAKMESKNAPCYSDTEVQILMRSNHWSEQDVKTILDLACQFSRKSKYTLNKK